MSLSDGLIDAWYFNNNEDNSVVGRSGFTSSFTASFIAGKNDKATSFNGTGYKTLSSSQNTFNLSSSKTITGWVYFGSLTGTQYIIGDYNPATPAASLWNIFITQAGSSLIFYLSNGTTSGGTTVGSLTTGKWYFFSWRYYSPLSSHYFSVRSDLGTTNYSIPSALTNTVNATVKISDSTFPLSNGSRVDNIQIWDRLLDDIELDEVYNSYLGIEVLNIPVSTPINKTIIRKKYFDSYSQQSFPYNNNRRFNILDENAVHTDIVNSINFYGYTTGSGIAPLSSYYMTPSTSGTFNIPPNSGISGTTYTNSLNGSVAIRQTPHRILEWVPVVDIDFSNNNNPGAENIAPNSGIPLVDIYITPSWDGDYSKTGYKRYIGTVFSNNYNYLNTDTTNKYRKWFMNNILPPIKNMNNFGVTIVNRTAHYVRTYVRMYPVIMEIKDE